MQILIVCDPTKDKGLEEAKACAHFIKQAFRMNDAVLIFNESEVDIDLVQNLQEDNLA